MPARYETTEFRTLMHDRYFQSARKDFPAAVKRSVIISPLREPAQYPIFKSLEYRSFTESRSQPLKKDFFNN